MRVFQIYFVSLFLYSSLCASQHGKGSVLCLDPSLGLIPSTLLVSWWIIFFGILLNAILTHPSIFTLQVYGYGGVSMVVEVSTDKVHRSVAKIREVIRDYGGKMADSGSVTFKFKRVRVVNIKATNADKDQLLSVALDAGAEDVIEPPTYEDDTEEDRSER